MTSNKIKYSLREFTEIRSDKMYIKYPCVKLVKGLKEDLVFRRSDDGNYLLILEFADVKKKLFF